MRKKQDKSGFVIPQTGRNVWFEISQDTDGTWHWVLWSGNGRMLARNALPMETQRVCEKSVKNMVKACGVAKYIVKVHSDKE